MHVMSVEYLRPMMGASPSSDQLQQQLSQNTRGHCRPSTREGGKGGAHRARALSAAARGPHLSTRNPRPKESARPGGMMHPKRFEAESLNPKVESGGQVTPKFGCEVTQNGADSPWLSDPGFWWLRDLGTDNRGFCY